MTEQDHQPDWVVIAQAQGVLSACGGVSITEAATTLRTRAWLLDRPIDRVARDLVRPWRSGAPAVERRSRPGPVVGLELDEEVALHEDMRRRRAEYPELDAKTEFTLRAHLGA